MKRIHGRSLAGERVAATRVGGVVLMLALGQAPSALADQKPPVFGASVTAVEVDVFVTNRDTPVTDLSAADFEVFDNGVRQEASLASLDTVGVTAVLAIDTSQSVRGATLAHLKDAARAFVLGLTDRDQAAVLAFSHELTLQSPATSDRAALERAIGQLSADGATAVFDALYVALERSWPGGRPMVVLYTDGADNLSWLDADTVLAAARESNALVYVVGPAPVETVAVDNALSLHAGAGVPAPKARPEDASVQRLREIAELTGGRFWTVESPAFLKQRFLDILAAMKTRYLLKYEPQGVELAGRHRIKVRVKGRKVDVRHRLEYSAPLRGSHP